MTFLSDILFGDDTKRIYRNEFNKALGQISDISKEERDYLNEVFKSDLADGLTGHELKQRIEKLRHNPNDSLEPHEVEQVRRKLLGELNKN